jgi:hypothetical protein
MKKILLFSLFLIINSKMSAGDEIIGFNYENGNGTILDVFVENGKKIEIRRHESRFAIYPYGEITAFSRPYTDSDRLFRLKDGDYVNTLEVACVINISDNLESNWVKIINDNNQSGWLDMNDTWGPYKNGNGAFVERIIVKDREWTIIKLNSGFSYWGTVNVHDKPGITDSTIVFKLINENMQQFSITSSEITRESDTIDGITDYWVKIKDEQGRTGWVFGGYITVERGGPKYHTPENDVEFRFNLP